MLGREGASTAESAEKLENNDMVHLCFQVLFKTCPEFVSPLFRPTRDVNTRSESEEERRVQERERVLAPASKERVRRTGFLFLCVAYNLAVMFQHELHIMQAYISQMCLDLRLYDKLSIQHTK